jgi:hypothetical protein
VFFFLPFALEPASPGPMHHKPLPMLPAPKSWPREEPAAGFVFADAIAQAGYIAADLLRRALISITSSLTALGNQANLLFSQAAAALAFDRMMRLAAPFFGIRLPAFGPFFPPQIWAAGLWPAPFQHPAWPSPAAVPAWPLNLWANTWPAMMQALTAWANIWEPAAAQHRPASSGLDGKLPFTATLSIPGFAWSVTLHR